MSKGKRVDKDKVRIVKITIISMLSFVVFLFLSLILLWIIKFFIGGKNDVKGFQRERPSDYHFYRFNPKTNTSSSGITKINTKLENDEYITYEDFEGNHILISNFGVRRYECTGTCYCTPKRRNAAVIERTFVGLIVAASAMLAKTLTKDRYDEICEKWLNTDCFDGEEVQSIVDGCFEMDEKDDEPFDEGPRKWLCTGNCLVKRIPRHDFYDFTVKKLGWWGEFMGGYPPSVHQFLDVFEETSLNFGCDELEMEATVDDNTEEGAVEKFIDGPLRKFCDAMSMGEINVIDDEHIDKVVDLVTIDEGYDNYLGVGFRQISKEGSVVKMEMCVSYCCEMLVNPFIKCLIVGENEFDHF